MVSVLNTAFVIPVSSNDIPHRCSYILFQTLYMLSRIKGVIKLRQNMSITSIMMNAANSAKIPLMMQICSILIYQSCLSCVYCCILFFYVLILRLKFCLVLCKSGTDPNIIFCVHCLSFVGHTEVVHSESTLFCVACHRIMPYCNACYKWWQKKQPCHIIEIMLNKRVFIFCYKNEKAQEDRIWHNNKTGAVRFV